MFRKWPATIVVLFLAVLCVAFTAGVQPAGAAGAYSIDMGAAQEYGVGGENCYWDIQKNISVGFGRGEFVFIFGNPNTRLIYKGGEGGGFMDAGQMEKPAGQQVLQFTPEALAINDTQYISQGHLYILKTLALGYYALYVDNIKFIRDNPYMDFTLYKLKGAPDKVSSQPPPQPANNLPDQETTDQSQSGRTTIKYNDGAEYTGEVSGGKPDGAGTMIYGDGAEYRGEWKNGLPDGDGTKTYANGDKYIGSWKGGKKEGWGIYVWADGDKYDGEWADGKRNGQGKLTTADGKVKEGLWKDSEFVGTSQESQQPSVANPAASSPDSPVVVLNGKELSFDVPPVIESDRTLVPLRAIFEALGAVVNWDEATQTITATKGSTKIVLQLGGQTAYKNGSAVTLDVPAKVIRDRTLVPLRFVSEALGAKVGWQESTQTVTIDPGAAETPVTPKEEPPQSPSTGQQGAESSSNNGSFSLTIYHGYNFDQQAVVESGQDVDINFISHWKYGLGTLTTDKIKEFEAKPEVSSITAQEMSGWKDYVIGPVPGNYYAIKARNGKCYLLELTSFENQGMAMSYWKVNFNWQEINVK